MVYEVLETEVFSKWFKRLKDKNAKISIARRILRLKAGNFGDSKFIGDNVFELRIDVGKGYRVYFMNRKGRIVLLLSGGNKTTQEADIKTAKKMVMEVLKDED
ncbi:MAG: type II toxin-antitoxin system RelE/ParE family toxin [Spirochaetia bacterium]|nr:type II toxin-antitoxin system RelE/ParE family toxin [Spirochaetia bacterium]